MMMTLAAIALTIALLVAARSFALGLDRVMSVLLGFPDIHRRLSVTGRLLDGIARRSQAFETSLRRAQSRLVRLRAAEHALAEEIERLSACGYFTIRTVETARAGTPVFLALLSNPAVVGEGGPHPPQLHRGWASPQPVLVRAPDAARAEEELERQYPLALGFRVQSVEPAAPDLVRRVWGPR